MKDLTLPFSDDDLLLGIKNNGWACDGEHFLKSGCFEGYGEPMKTLDVQGYFNARFQVCTSCAERAKKNEEYQQWHAYYIYDKKKNEMNFDYFVVIRKFIRGSGKDEVGEYTINGSHDPSSHYVAMLKQYVGKHAVQYNGSLKDGHKILGTWVVDGMNDKFRISKGISVEFVKPYTHLPLQEGEIKVSSHKCVLKGPTEAENWGCDGRAGRELFPLCFGGITGFKQTEGVKRYRCADCDFDLCEDCLKFSIYADSLVKENKQ